MYGMLAEMGVLSCDLKSGRESPFQMSGGKEFQSLGAEHLNALLPMVARQPEGTLR